MTRRPEGLHRCRVAADFLLIATTILAAPVVGSQTTDLDQQLQAAPDGSVHMTFTARPGICGQGDWMSTDHNGSRVRRYSTSSDVEWDNECDDGPVRVVIEMRDHTPVRIRTYIGGRWRARPPGAPTVTDLGTVPAARAAGFLMGLARRLPANPGADAIFPATLADSSAVWPSLGTLARDEGRPTRTREQAVFWLGQAAADVSAGLDSLAEDTSIDEDVREHAVFALSQRPHDEGVPALIRIATSNHDAGVRRKALFWLGQSGDPRAVEIFEKILTAPR
jgi:hypothetical protein